MSGTHNRSGAFVILYMISMHPALRTLRGTPETRSTTTTKFIGSVLVLTASLSTYAASHFYPEQIHQPFLGPAGAVLAMAIAYTMFWLTDPQTPNENAG